MRDPLCTNGTVTVRYGAVSELPVKERNMKSYQPSTAPWLAALGTLVVASVLTIRKAQAQSNREWPANAKSTSAELGCTALGYHQHHHWSPVPLFLTRVAGRGTKNIQATRIGTTNTHWHIQIVYPSSCPDESVAAVSSVAALDSQQTRHELEPYWLCFSRRSR